MKALNFDSFWNEIGEHGPAEVAEVAEARNSQMGFPPPDLSYMLREVQQCLPTLTPGHREVFDYWFEAYTEKGWCQEEAERGAFAQTMGKGPMRLKAMGIWRDYPVAAFTRVTLAEVRLAEAASDPGTEDPGDV